MDKKERLQASLETLLTLVVPIRLCDIEALQWSEQCEEVQHQIQVFRQEAQALQSYVRGFPGEETSKRIDIWISFLLSESDKSIKLLSELIDCTTPRESHRLRKRLGTSLQNWVRNWIDIPLPHTYLRLVKNDQDENAHLE